MFLIFRGLLSWKPVKKQVEKKHRWKRLDLHVRFPLRIAMDGSWACRRSGQKTPYSLRSAIQLSHRGFLLQLPYEHFPTQVDECGANGSTVAKILFPREPGSAASALQLPRHPTWPPLGARVVAAKSTCCGSASCPSAPPRVNQTQEAGQMNLFET